MSDLLAVDEVRFINLVAARRFAADAALQPPALVLEGVHGDTAHDRAAALGAALLRPGVLEVAALPTALLAVCCQLRREGQRLLAPQGVAAGMIRGLAAGEVSAGGFADWLRDRAVAE